MEYADPDQVGVLGALDRVGFDSSRSDLSCRHVMIA
jgi:hypothetical protein